MFIELSNGTIGLLDNLLFYIYSIKEIVCTNVLLITRSTSAALSAHEIDLHHQLYVVLIHRLSSIPIFGATLFVVQSCDEVSLLEKRRIDV